MRVSQLGGRLDLGQESLGTDDGSEFGWSCPDLVDG